MGHIKLAKASGFDVVSADGIGAVKLTSNKVVIEYMAGKEVQISGASNLVQADVDAVVAAIDIMEGGSGKAPLTELSSKVTGTSVEDIA
jgi:hypothetical protein